MSTITLAEMVKLVREGIPNIPLEAQELIASALLQYEQAVRADVMASVGARLERYNVALHTITNFPIPEQDNMVAANMRIVARTALSEYQSPLKPMRAVSGMMQLPNEPYPGIYIRGDDALSYGRALNVFLAAEADSQAQTDQALIAILQDLRELLMRCNVDAKPQVEE